jgi:hypothetical protein
MYWPRPTHKQVEAAAPLLWRIAGKHGLSDLRFGEDAGELVAAVDDDRTYFDIAAFEAEVEGILGWRPSLIPNGAPGAKPGAKLARDRDAA